MLQTVSEELHIHFAKTRGCFKQFAHWGQDRSVSTHGCWQRGCDGSSSERGKYVWEQIGDLSSYLKCTFTQQNFNLIDIVGGGVVDLFAFGGAMCVQRVEDDASDLVCQIVDWMATYLDEHIDPWVQSQGGWVSAGEGHKLQLCLCCSEICPPK